MKHVVYQIKINGLTRYIGRTLLDRVDKREKEHNYQYKKGKVKLFYDYLTSINYSNDIILEPIYICDTKVEAKRYEMYMILWFYFEVDSTQLKQRIPQIKDF